MKKRVRRETAELFEREKDAFIPRKITEKDLDRLPEPVQRYLRYTQIIGKERVRSVRLKQKGFFRTRPDQKWMPLRAEEYFTIDPPGFLWYGKMHPFPFVTVSGIDKFIGGKGSLVIKFMSAVKVGEFSGEDCDQAELVRYLNEMVWFPSAFLSEYIQWEHLNSHSARAIIRVAGISASADLYFGQDGQITNFVAERYMDVGGGGILKKWSTPFKEYRAMNGVNVPVQGEGIWKLSSGDFSYVRITEIPVLEYNNPAVF